MGYEDIYIVLCVTAKWREPEVLATVLKSCFLVRFALPTSLVYPFICVSRNAVILLISLFWFPKRSRSFICYLIFIFVHLPHLSIFFCVCEGGWVCVSEYCNEEVDNFMFLSIPINQQNSLKKTSVAHDSISLSR